jgi:hypothetical protein
VILTLNIGHQAIDHHSEPEIGDERQLATNRKKSFSIFPLRISAAAEKLSE